MKNLRLLELRTRRGKTQIQTSRDLGITPEYYGKIELNKLKPSFKLAIRMADYFETTVDDLFCSKNV